VVGFFATSAFHFLLAIYKAAEPDSGQGEYETPIFSKTRFKRPPFWIFANLRASHSPGLKLPNTFSISISTSAKK
jgi:hypothetical protein